METHKVTCDHCDKDLTSTGNCEDWRLVLANERVHSWSPSGIVTAMHVPPSLDRSHHFCGLGCLHAWIEKLTEKWRASAQNLATPRGSP